MKFALTTDYRYPWPVTIRKPDPKKPGKAIEQTFEMTFRQLPDAEAKEIDAIGAAAKTPAELNAHEHDLLRRVCVGWNDDVVDTDGEPVPFSAELFEQALQDVYFRIGVYQAYRASIALDGGRLGN